MLQNNHQYFMLSCWIFSYNVDVIKFKYLLQICHALLLGSSCKEIFGSRYLWRITWRIQNWGTSHLEFPTVYLGLIFTHIYVRVNKWICRLQMLQIGPEIYIWCLSSHLHPLIWSVCSIITHHIEVIFLFWEINFI